MSRVNSEEMLRCDKEGYFDLDCLKPYSSVWVSTCRRDVRTKKEYADEETDAKKVVTSSRACNNLHTLLENGEGVKQNSCEDASKPQNPQLFSAKSDFLINHYKYEKGDCASVKKIPDKIIESMCRNDSKCVYDSDEDSPRRDLSTTKGQSNLICFNSLKDKDLSDDKITLDEFRHSMNQMSEEETDLEATRHNVKKLLSQKRLEDWGEISIKESEKETAPFITIENIEESKRNKLLSENGKLVSELGITTLNLKDQSGREFPITVKYVWETDTAEVLNAAENVINTSQNFINIIESVSSIGFKQEKSESNVSEKIGASKVEDEPRVHRLNTTVTRVKDISDMGRKLMSNTHVGGMRQHNQINHIRDTSNKTENAHHTKKGLQSKVSSHNQLNRKNASLHFEKRDVRSDFGIGINSNTEVQRGNSTELELDIEDTKEFTKCVETNKREKKFTNQDINLLTKRKGSSNLTNEEQSDSLRTSTRPATCLKPLTKKESVLPTRFLRPPSAPIKKSSVQLSSNPSGDAPKHSASTFRKKSFGTKFIQSQQMNSKTIWK